VALVRVLSSLFLAGSVIISFVNVVMRYVFKKALVWGDEVSLFLMIWSIFLSTAVLTYTDRHLKMEALFQRLPSRARRSLEYLAGVVALVVSAYVVKSGWEPTRVALETGHLSETGTLPMVYVYASVPVGFALVGLAAAWRVFSLATNKRGSGVEKGRSAA